MSLSSGDLSSFWQEFALCFPITEVMEVLKFMILNLESVGSGI